MEDVLVAALKNDVTLSAIIADRLYAPASLGIGNNPAAPEKPYVQWNEIVSTSSEVVKETSNATTRTFQIFVYGELGDPGRVNEVMREAKRVVKALAPYDVDGVRISQSDWNGESSLMEDSVMKAVVRIGMASFMVNR